MFKGISPIISPGFLGPLDRINHGNEIIFANAHFSGKTYNDYTHS